MHAFSHSSKQKTSGKTMTRSLQLIVLLCALCCCLADNVSTTEQYHKLSSTYWKSCIFYKGLSQYNPIPVVYYPLEQTFSPFNVFEFVFLLYDSVPMTSDSIHQHFILNCLIWSSYADCCLSWRLKPFIQFPCMSAPCFTGPFYCRWSFSALREGLVFTEVSLTGSQPEGRFWLFMSRSLHLPLTPPVSLIALLFISSNNTNFFVIIISLFIFCCQPRVCVPPSCVFMFLTIWQLCFSVFCIILLAVYLCLCGVFSTLHG